jgi:hypothetical protein
MNDVENFHDAVLVDLTFDWMSRRLRCSIRLVSDNAETRQVIFEGVSKLVAPCSHPWGRSSSINVLKRSPHGDEFVFNLEMQSGDIIEIYAAAMRLE